MATRKRSTRQAADEQPAAPAPADEQPEQPAEVEEAPDAEPDGPPERVTMAPAPVRKFRVRGDDKPLARAGGYVLTERGWVRER